MNSSAESTLSSILGRWGNLYHQAIEADLVGGGELLIVSTDDPIELALDPAKYAKTATLTDPPIVNGDEVQFHIEDDGPDAEPYRMPKSKVLEGEPQCGRRTDFCVFLARNA